MSSTACCPPPVRRWPDDHARDRTGADRRGHPRSGGLHGRGTSPPAWTRGWIARRATVHPRPVSHDVPGTALDDAAVRGVRIAGGDERAVPVPARAGPDRAVRGVRPADAAGLRLGASRGAAPRSAGWASRSTPPTTWWICSPDLPLDRISVNFTINATAPIILAMYLVAAERQGVAPADLAGTMQNDILKEFLARKTFVFPPEPSIRLSLRRDRVRGRDAAAVQPDLDHGLSRARGRLRRRPGARAHAGLGDRVRRTARGTRAGVRHVRPPAVVPLRDDDGSVRGGGEAPGREADVVPDRDRAVRRDRSQLGTPAVLLGELGHDADRAAAAEQRRSGRRSSASARSWAGRSRST